MSEQILTTGEAARRAELSGQYLRKLCREGKLAYQRTESGQYLFQESEIKRFIAERLQERGSE